MKETEFAKLLGDLPENYILRPRPIGAAAAMPSGHGGRC